MRDLGKNQRSALETLIVHNGWWPGCGWIWENNSVTIRLLDGLVKRGLVEKIEEPRGPLRRRVTHIVYRVTGTGRAEIARSF